MSRILTRQKIISDCAALFNQKGYLNIGIPEIEKATGQTKAVLYGYFDNKHNLAKAVLMHNLEYRRIIIQEQVSLQLNYLNRLLTHIDVHDPEKKHFTDGGCIILNAAIETDYTEEDMRQIVANALLTWKQDIIALIEAGIKAGEFQITLPVEKLAWLVISLVEGALFVCHTNQNAKLGNQLLKQARITFLSYVKLNALNG